jgi:hypothetical protein
MVLVDARELGLIVLPKDDLYWVCRRVNGPVKAWGMSLNAT